MVGLVMSFYWKPKVTSVWRKIDDHPWCVITRPTAGPVHLHARILENCYFFYKVCSWYTCKWWYRSLKHKKKNSTKQACGEIRSDLKWHWFESQDSCLRINRQSLIRQEEGQNGCYLHLLSLAYQSAAAFTRLLIGWSGYSWSSIAICWLGFGSNAICGHSEQREIFLVKWCWRRFWAEKNEQDLRSPAGSHVDWTPVFPDKASSCPVCQQPNPKKSASMNGW